MNAAILVIGLAQTLEKVSTVQTRPALNSRVQTQQSDWLNTRIFSLSEFAKVARICCSVRFIKGTTVFTLL